MVPNDQIAMTVIGGEGGIASKTLSRFLAPAGRAARGPIRFTNRSNRGVLIRIPPQIKKAPQGAF